MDLTHRVREPEVMDRLDLDPVRHCAALRGLERLNRVAASARCFLGPLRKISKQSPGETLRVLDVACGGGDNLFAIERAARTEGLALELFGCDRSEIAVAHAREHASRIGSEVEFSIADGLRDEHPPRRTDVVLNSLFLHHLDPEDVRTFLIRASRWSTRAVIVVDLIRSRLGYALAYAASRFLTDSTIVRHDALVSVRAAYTLDEARELAAGSGAAKTLVEKVWPERFRMILWSK